MNPGVAWPRTGPGAAARRAVAALGSVGAGMVLARYWLPLDSVVWLGIAGLMASIAGVVRGRACAAALVIAGVALGAGWFALRVREAPADSIRWATQWPGLVTVEGVVLDEPREWVAEAEGRPTARLNLWLDAVVTGDGAIGASGRLRVAVEEGLDGRARAGDQVRVSGMLLPVAPPMNPGERDRRLWAAQEGMAGLLAVPRAELVAALPPSTGAWRAVRAAGLRARAGLSERARGLLLGGFEGRGEARAVLAAMILGEEDPGLDDVRTAFTRIGLAQVMAISGFNLAVMAWVALLLVRATGDRGRAEALVVGLLVLLYLMILPAEAPILRSGIMVLTLLGAEAVGRRHGRVAVLAWTAVGLLLWRPMDLWSLGFQLSFGLVGAMLVLGPMARETMFGVRVAGGMPGERRWWHGPAEQARTGASTAVLCWAVATPIVMYHTGLFSPIALVAMAVMVVPVAALMWLSYGLLVVGMLVPAAGAPVGAALEWTAGLTVWLVRAMDGLPLASVSLPGVSLGWMVLALVAVVYWCVRGYVRNRMAWGLTAVCAAWLAVEVGFGARLPAAMPMRIDTLAVGDGSCHLIRSGGEAMLWDCGSGRPGVGRWLVPRAVRAVGGWRVRTVVLTHPNADHFNGILDASGPLGVREVLVPRRFLEEADARPGSAAAGTLRGLRKRGIEVREVGAGASIRLGSVAVRFVSPPEGAAWPQDNDHSLSAVFTPGGGAPTLMMTGDMQDEAIGALLSVPGLHADVLELPHHGSAREWAMRLVEAVDPTVILQSTGPSRVADARWDALRTRRAWYTTAVDGAIWAECRADGTVRSGAFLRGGFESRMVGR